MCAKIYGKIKWFYFCKDYLHINFVHYNSSEKDLSKTHRNLGNSMDFKKYFIILRMHWFVFDWGIKKVNTNVNTIISFILFKNN